MEKLYCKNIETCEKTSLTYRSFEKTFNQIKRDENKSIVYNPTVASKKCFLEYDLSDFKRELPCGADDIIFDILKILERARNASVNEGYKIVTGEAYYDSLATQHPGLDKAILLIWLYKNKILGLNPKEIEGSEWLPNHAKKGKRNDKNTQEDFDNWDY